VLVEQGLGDLTVEALVVKYANLFPERTVKLAAQRIVANEAGL
jgi:hypothetical protein